MRYGFSVGWYVTACALGAIRLVPKQVWIDAIDADDRKQS